jgi:hypothetical protein
MLSSTCCCLVTCMHQHMPHVARHLSNHGSSGSSAVSYVPDIAACFKSSAAGTIIIIQLSDSSCTRQFGRLRFKCRCCSASRGRPLGPKITRRSLLHCFNPASTRAHAASSIEDPDSNTVQLLLLTTRCCSAQPGCCCCCMTSAAAGCGAVCSLAMCEDLQQSKSSCKVCSLVRLLRWLRAASAPAGAAAAAGAALFSN